MSVNLFDANYYRAANADLRSLNDAQALNHFQSFGLNEGRAFSSLVDLNFYRASNSDLAGFNNRQAYDHLSNFGVKEGRRFSPFADLNFYRNNNSDLKELNSEQLFDHLRSNGVSEGRNFSQFVNLNFYRSDNGDLARAGLSNNQLLQDLAINGIKQGREFSAFIDLDYYLKANADVNQAFGGDRLLALNHLETVGINEGRTFSRYVDINYYLSKNSDVNQVFAGNKALAFDHLVSFGMNEGRQFSTTFEADFYRNNYQDLKNSGMTNLQLFDHWVISGASVERRIGSPDAGGNTVTAARELGSVAGNFEFKVNDTIGGTDKNDYYRFTLTESRDISIKLSGLSADLDVMLLDGNGNALTDSTGKAMVDSKGSALTAPHATGTANEGIIYSNLKAGTYSIRVYQGDTNASSNYHLSLTAGAIADPGNFSNPFNVFPYDTPEEGNFNSASRIMIFGSIDSTTSTDSEDVYKVNLGIPNGSFNAKVTPLSTANADLYLMDQSGFTFNRSERPGADSKTNALVGTYYVRVANATSPAEYQLTLSYGLSQTSDAV